MKQPDIYQYSSFGEYLIDLVNFRKQKRSQYSMRALAQKMGRSPSLLAMVGRGERIPGPDLTQELGDALKLTPRQIKYAVTLNNYHRAKTPAAKRKHGDALRLLKPKNEDLLLDLDSFEIISRWYHVVILELVSLNDFVEDIDQIYQLLGTGVSRTMVKDSIALLERLKLIGRTATGTLKRLPNQIRLPKTIPSAAIRSFHKEVLLRGHQALDRQSMKERYFTTATVAVPEDLVEEVSDRIATFRDELVSFISDNNDQKGCKIYHFGCQLFRATTV